MKQRCGRCGEMTEPEFEFRRLGWDNYTLSLCWDCGQKTKDFIDELFYTPRKKTLNKTTTTPTSDSLSETTNKEMKK